jgi:hypothetical protein
VCRIIIYEAEGGNGPRGSFRMHTEAHRTGDAPGARGTDTPCAMESAAKRRLGDIVVERNMVTPQQLEHALSEQQTHGGKLGETLVELGYLTRVELAGAISEQWDDLRKCRSGADADAERPRPTAAQPALPAPTGPSAAELALRERVDALTVELAARDQRIAQQDATINALLARVTEFESHPV